MGGHNLLLLGVTTAVLAGCSGRDGGERVRFDETLLQVAATGSTDTRPDEARFTAGVQTLAASAAAASKGNAERTQAVVAALRGLGIGEDDLRTRALTMNRIDYGPERGRFQASNMIDVRVREIGRASEAIGAATEAGANILSGPDLRVANPEAAGRAAYAQAFRAARARADAYAEAAGLKVVRVIAIRDGETWGPQPYGIGPMTVSPTSVAAQSAPPVMTGTAENEVRIRVDFALSK